MKTIVTVISASVLVAASATASAWGWGPYNGYAPYGYAPYGYGVPMQPPVELTDAQRKAMQDQQAKAFEYMQNVQTQMAKYYAEHPDPITTMERRMYQDQVAQMQDMNKMVQETQQQINKDMQDSMSAYPVNGFEQPPRPEDDARLKEMEKQAQEQRKAAEERRAAYLKAAEQRRLDAQKRYQERSLDRGYHISPVMAPQDEVPPPAAAKPEATKS